MAEGSPWGWGCASCRQVPWGSLFPSLGVLLLPPGRDHPGGVGGAHLALPASDLGWGECVNATCRLPTPLGDRDQPQATAISLPLLPALPRPLFGVQGHLSPCPTCPLLLCLAKSCPLPSLAAGG